MPRYQSVPANEGSPLSNARSVFSVDVSRNRGTPDDGLRAAGGTSVGGWRALLSALISPSPGSGADHPRGAREGWVPEDEASRWGRWLFTYCSSLVKLGWKYSQEGVGMEMEDLWDLAEQDQARVLSEQFNRAMDKTRDRYPSKRGSVAWALWSCHRGVMLLTAGQKVIHDLLQFAFPVLLRWMLQHLQNDGNRGGAVLIAFLMLATLVVKTVIINQYFNSLFRVGMHMKAQLVHMLYDKALRITEPAKAKHGVGGIVNLQSNDASKLWNLPSYIHVLWSGPLQIIICMALLVSVVGLIPSAVALGATLVLVPLSTSVGRILLPIRKKLIGITDQRVKACSEVVTGIKAIKLYAWEQPYTERIEKLRAQELAAIQKVRLIGVINSVVFSSSPILTTLAVFITYTSMGMALTPDVAFTALSLFGLLRFPVSVLPRQIINVINANVAIKRIQDFMDLEEYQPSIAAPPPGQREAALQVSDASFCWSTRVASDVPPVLRNVSLRVNKGELVVIVGAVGAGKSSLLQAMLGELRTLQGSVMIDPASKIAYTAQDPWIQNATVRDNVTMGTEPDPSRYDATLEACALLPDLDVLAAGDETEIGEKGVNLSGGQKQRVALARAVYADADVYLLDDPLSAVDAHVQAHLMRKCICGMLRHKTRVLVTHQVQHARAADRVVLEGGSIKHQGTPAELKAKGVDLAAFCVASRPNSEDSGDRATRDMSQADLMGMEASASGRASSASPAPTDAVREARTASASAAEAPAPDRHAANGREGSSKNVDGLAGMLHGGDRAGAGRAGASGAGEKHKEEGGGVGRHGGGTKDAVPGSKLKGRKAPSKGRLVEKEMRQVGQVKASFYYAYLSSWSPYYWIPIAALLMSVGSQAILQVTNWWLQLWSSRVQSAQAAAGRHDGDPVAPAGKASPGIDTMYYLAVYNVLSVAGIVTQAFRSLFIVLGSMGASRRLHDRLLAVVMRLPMSFFDTQPAGRLLNRFTRDMDQLDLELGSNFESIANFGMMLVANMAMVAYVSPPVAAIFAVLSLVYLRVLRIYVATSREVKRIDSVQNSPIFSHFSESIAGLVTLRAFAGAAEQGVEKDLQLVDRSTRAHWPSTVLNRWLSIQLEMLGNAVIFATALLTCVAGNRAAGMAGLALSSAINLTGLLNWVVRCVSDVEVSMNSVERICEYLDHPTEAPAIIPGERPPAGWPSSGVIDVRNLVVRYRPDLDPVIHGISFATRAREKVGVVGRTGCGKSTLMLTLFRIVEPTQGEILVDGINTSSLGLFDLRSRLALVPQDPVIFSGTVRSNLDPFGAVPEDASIWEALSRVHMATVVKGLGGLDSKVAEGGGNLSVGQRQLLCMARALLRNSRVLLLDEATSNVDNATDAVIQRTIREAFRGCTVLTIAHRLNTIVDYDRILVLDHGRIAEFDSPRVLLARPGSAFGALVAETGGVGEGQGDDD